MDESKRTESSKKFLFSVEIMIEDDTNGRALEKLLSTLNTSKVNDYKINSGIELGSKIESALKETRQKLQNAAKANSSKSSTVNTADSGSSKSNSSNSSSSSKHQAFFDQMKQFKDSNTLIRLTIVKAKGVKLNIPCRVLNFDPIDENISVYHVDEKQVYLFKINEIDDFEVR
jgi:hypothetical protein